MEANDVLCSETLPGTDGWIRLLSLALRTNWLDLRQEGVHPAGKLAPPPFKALGLISYMQKRNI